MSSQWPFDQTEDSAAVTTVYVLDKNYPILHVVHYDDDHSWGFFCGTTDDVKDGRVVALKEIVAIDPSVLELARLEPGMKASRRTKNSAWILRKAE